MMNNMEPRMSDGKSVTTPLQQAWARVWAAKRDGDSREFESAMFAVVDAATREGREAARRELSDK